MDIFIHYNPLFVLLEKYPLKPWNWCLLSGNPNITWEIIVKNLEKPWNWTALSENPNITWEHVEKNPLKPWDWDGLSWNPNITWEIVEKNPKKPWNWIGLSYNKFTLQNKLIKKKRNSVLIFILKSYDLDQVILSNIMKFF